MKYFSLTLPLIYLILMSQLVAQPDVAALRHISMDESQADTNRLWALDSIALIVYQNQPDSAFYYANKQFQLAKYLNNKRWMAIGEQNIGTAYYLQGDLTNALKHYKESLVWMKEVGNKKGVAGMLINIGIQYGGQGNFTQSQKYTLEALKIAEEIGDKEFEANALGRLGTINYQNGNTEEAKDYFLRAYRTNEESGANKGLLASSLVNLGIFFSEEGEYEEAISYTLRSAEIFKELDGKYGLADAYSNLGYIYGNTGEHDKQLEYYHLALQIEQEIGNQHGESALLTYIGEAYLERKNHPQAIEYLSKAQALAQQIGDIKSEKEITRQLFLAYKGAGRYETALDKHEFWVMMRDSLNQEEQAKELLKQQFQFEQDKKDALAKEELARQNLQRNASLIGLGLVGILAFVLFQNGRRRRKTNELLSVQKTEIETKSQQNELLLKEIHHRVKNNLQTISSLLYLQSAHIKDAEVKQAVSDGRHRVESMALIHQKLYQRDNLAAIEMKDYLTNLGRSLLTTLGYQTDRIQLHIDMEELELDVDTAIPLGLIVNELVTNSLKYAFPDGRNGYIRMSLVKRPDDKLELQVADNGIGATNTKSGTLFGSQLIKLLTVQLGGTIEQGSEKGYWTKVVV